MVEPVSSSVLLGSVIDSNTVSVLSVFSQQDLTINDHTRFSRSRSPGKEDSVDIEMRGKDLATRCWLEDEEFLAKDKIAEWLGGQSVLEFSTTDDRSRFNAGVSSTRLLYGIILTSLTSLAYDLTMPSGMSVSESTRRSLTYTL